jgi:predicted TIM-barrel fold metal-dependent hydrolase
MMPARVVDAHHHLWDLSAGRYPGLSGPRESQSDPLGKGSLQRDYLLSDYLADAARVPLVGSVHVEAAHDPSAPVEETRWLDRETSSSDLPIAIVAHARLEAPELGELLDAHQRSGRVVGIRQMLDWQGGRQRPSDLLADARWLAGLRLLPPRHLSFDLQVVPSQLTEAARVAADNPDVCFVLDHGGYHLAGAESEWRRGLARIARESNVKVKVSGYQTVDPHHRDPGFRDFVRSCVDAFGPSRSMFASNFPFDGRSIDMHSLVERVAASLPELTPAEADEFWAGTAARTYRLDLHPTAVPNPAAGQGEGTCQI